MNTKFDCLNRYFDFESNDENRRLMAVQAALELVNTGVSPDNPFKTLNAVTGDSDLISVVADKIQTAIESVES